MKASDYIAKFLVKQGVTDAFGIPGGVVLDLLYALEKTEGIVPHLCYHEQSAGFAACGYAQVSGRLGVAYATRGPGFTNLISAIADAFSDSIPVMFITGHSCMTQNPKMRVVADQEFDTCGMVKTITKYSARIDSKEELPSELAKAYTAAMTGRKGPVLLDIASTIWKADVADELIAYKSDFIPFSQKDANDIAEQIQNARRPVFLIGDGVHQASVESHFRSLVSRAEIPVVSSRYAHDIVGDNNLYYGYIGSHGIREANFILSKADLIISIGNRLCFPIHSESYQSIVKRASFIRVEIDEGELERVIPNTIVYRTDLNSFFDGMLSEEVCFGNHHEWKNTCDTIRCELHEKDLNDAVSAIEDRLRMIPDEGIVVNDVGNNEFWVSRACVHSKSNKRTLYSKSFGALGCALGKSIGAFYATKKTIVCFVGDQGLQMNIQELQAIVQNKLPITVILLNNHSSGMIKDRETLLFDGKYLHTTTDSGYGTPNFGMIAKGYGLDSSHFKEIDIDERIGLSPQLPKGNPIQKMSPLLDESLFNELNDL